MCWLWLASKGWSVCNFVTKSVTNPHFGNQKNWGKANQQLFNIHFSSFFSSGHRDQIAYSLLGGFSKSQSIGYPVTRLCRLLVIVLLSPFTDGSGTLLSPPSKIPLELLVYSQFARACISLSSSFLLSVRMSLSAVRPYD